MSFISGSNGLTDWVYIKGTSTREGSVRLRALDEQLEVEVLSNGLWCREYVGSGGDGGFLVDYNDATTASTPISLTADTWTTITNDGAGAFTNLDFLPETVTRLMNTATGEIDPTDLNLGSSLLIRNDFTVTPTVNNSALDFQYTLGTGGGAYTLGLALGRLDRGAGIGYRFSMRVDKIYMGDTNTRDNPIGLQVKCSSDATLVNAGISITVVNN